jgi:peroxiredoxin/outer membrane lipoprotein-sorting protein
MQYQRRTPHGLTKGPTLILLGLAALSPAISFATDPTAAQILKRVSETYQGLKTFSFVAEQGLIKTRVAESRPGKVRLTNDRYTLVSNGAVTWVYLPNRTGGEYTQVDAAPLLEETWRVSPLGFSGWFYLRSYNRVPADGAKVEGEKILRVKGRLIHCYVVRLPVSCSRGLLSWVGGTEDLWVSKSRFIVRGTVAAELRSATTWGCPPVSVIPLTLKSVDRGPVPEDDFRFDPPPGARRVSQLTDNEGGYLWNGGLYDGPNAAPFPYPIFETATDFTLRGLDGKGFRLHDLRGTIAVLDFWASWCKPCLGELAAVQRLYDELASKGVVFLGIDDESPETIRAFVEANGYTFPMLLDSGQAVHELYGVRWAPTTVVIDRKGKIAAQYIGAGGEAQLRQALKAAGLDTTKY